MKRLVVLVAFGLAACGGVGVTPAAQGTLIGKVVASPCRPVERVGDPPCPPVPGVTVELGRVTAVTDATGTYRVTLPAGTYPIKIKAGARERPANPASVTVPAGSDQVLDLTYDSGIR